jgi:biotin operon repressor
MESIELQGLIAAGEGYYLEFKESVDKALLDFSFDDSFGRGSDTPQFHCGPPITDCGVSDPSYNQIPCRTNDTSERCSGVCSFTVTFRRMSGNGQRPSLEKPMAEVGSQKSSQKSSQKIVELISEKPGITIEELAAIVGIGERGIKKQLQTLKLSGMIIRIGPDKGGHWEVISRDEG